MGCILLLFLLPSSSGYNDDVLDEVDCVTTPISQSNVSNCDDSGNCIATVLATIDVDFLAGPSCISYVPTSDELDAVQLFIIPSTPGFAVPFDTSFYTDDPQCFVAGYDVALFSLTPDPEFRHDCRDCPYRVLDSTDPLTNWDACFCELPLCKRAKAEYLVCDIKDRYFVGNLGQSYSFSVEVEVVIQRGSNRTSLGYITITNNQNYANFSEVTLTITGLSYQAPSGMDSVIFDKMKPSLFYILQSGYVNDIDDTDPEKVGFLKHHEGNYYPTTIKSPFYDFHYVGKKCDQKQAKGGLALMSIADFLDNSLKFSSSVVAPGSYLINQTGPDIEVEFNKHSDFVPRLGDIAFTSVHRSTGVVNSWGCWHESSSGRCRPYPSQQTLSNVTYSGAIQTNTEYYDNATVTIESVAMTYAFMYNESINTTQMSPYYIRRGFFTDELFEFTNCLTNSAGTVVYMCADFGFITVTYPEGFPMVQKFGDDRVEKYLPYTEQMSDPEGLFAPATVASAIASIYLHGFDIRFDSSTPTPVIKTIALSDKNELILISTYSTRQSGTCVLQFLPLGFAESKEFTLTTNVVDIETPVLFDKFNGYVTVTVLCRTANATKVIKFDYNNELNHSHDNHEDHSHACQVFDKECYSTQDKDECGLWGFSCFKDHFSLNHFFGLGFKSPADWVASVIKIVMWILGIIIGIFLIYLILKLGWLLLKCLYPLIRRCVYRRKEYVELKNQPQSAWKMTKSS